MVFLGHRAAVMEYVIASADSHVIWKIQFCDAIDPIVQPPLPLGLNLNDAGSTMNKKTNAPLNTRRLYTMSKLLTLTGKHRAVSQ